MAKRKRGGSKGAKDSGGFGVPLEDFGEEFIDATLGVLVGTSAKERGLPQKRTLLRNHLMNGERWDAWLAELPGLCLLALEALVEAGGAIQLDDLEILVAERSGCELDEAHIACALLLNRMLAVPLATPDSGELDAIAVYRDTLPILEARVRGISLPALPDTLQSKSQSIATDSRQNRILAIAGLTAHRRLRFTNAGAPDRTTLKRFAKGLGCPADEVFDLAKTAIERGYLGARDENLVPRAQRMIDGTPPSERDGDGAPPIQLNLDSWLEDGEWFSHDALLRACVRGFIDQRGGTSQVEKGFHLESDTTSIFDYLQDAIAMIDSFDHHQSQDDDWLRKCSPPTERTGDGHVTPNLEVMLGPAAHPEVVAVVSLGCELRQVDRVLTFRITPESVARGRVAGLAPGQLAGTLESVGRHAVPANVLQLVGEWEEATRPARIARGWFLFIGSDLHPALEKGILAPHLIGSPMAGVLELDPETPRALIERALAEHATDASLHYPMSEALAQRDAPVLEAKQDRVRRDDWTDDEDWLDEGDRPMHLDLGERPWSLEPAGDSALRARVESTKARGFGEDLREKLVESGSSAPISDSDIAQLSELAPALAKLDSQAARELNRFARKLDPIDRDGFNAMRAAGLPLAPFLALKQKWRRRIVQQADTVVELIALANDSAGMNRCTPSGEQLLARMGAMGLAFDERRRGLANAPIEFPGKKLRLGKGRDEVEVVVRIDSEPSSSRPGRSTDSSLAQTSAGDFPELDAGELFRQIAHAAEHRRPVECLVESDAGRRVLELRVERVEIQDGRQVVLAKDLRTFDRRVVPVREIVSIRL